VQHVITRRLLPLALAPFLLLTLFLSACGSGSGTITLTYLNWNKSDQGVQFDQVVSAFEKANPSIKIQVQNIDTTQYEQVLQTRLVAGDAPDIVASHGGSETFIHEIQAGYFVDLSNQPWVANEFSGAKAYGSLNGKVYGMALQQYLIGVIYNKQIFSQLGLSVPRSWSDFLAVCEKIKAAGLYPVALGYKDSYTAQFIPYAMGPTAVFGSDPNFNQQLASGQQTFSGSAAWQGMLADVESLVKNGYTNPSPNGTSYDQAVQLIATGKAAMFGTGNWSVPDILKGNPSAQLGMFTMPYKEPPFTLASSPGQLMLVTSKSQHVAEAEKFLNFWSSQSELTSYITAVQGIPNMKNIHITDHMYDLMLSDEAQGGSHNFLNAEWPAGVDQAMDDGIQGMVDGSATISQTLANMDAAYQKNKSSLPPIQ